MFPEPVEDVWKIPLQRFYSDPARWAFSFQIEVLKWFRKLRDTALWTPCHDKRLIARNTHPAHPPLGCVIQQTPSDWIKIVERSPNVGFWVFSQNLHHQGNLSDKELRLPKDVVSDGGGSQTTPYMFGPPLRKHGRDSLSEVARARNLSPSLSYNNSKKDTTNSSKMVSV